MKKLILSLLLVSSAALAQDPFAGTTKITISPFQGSSEAMQFSTGGLLVSSIATSYEGRGVAAKEQLRDELVAFDRDVRLGLVKDALDIRQEGLKELVFEILADEEKMKELNAAIPTGTPVDKITTALTLSLF